ncbi:hypothetical protein CPC08DRAFT_727604 [Agrocybe pediades]|nr:hypothetical protein CPC08DRAFT_727604 [Agrocybe pediades]
MQRVNLLLLLRPLMVQITNRLRKREEAAAARSSSPAAPESPPSGPHIAQINTRSEDGTKKRTTTYINESPPKLTRPADDSAAQDLPSSVPKQKQQSRLSATLQEFQEKKHELLEYLFDREHHPLIGSPCSCGKDLRTDHTTRPCHWANVWQNEAGYFARRDISMLLPNNSYSIALGHGGARCPHPVGYQEKPVNFQIIDSNGVHETRVHFCTCHGHPNRIKQLKQKKQADIVTAGEKAAHFLNEGIKLEFDQLKLLAKISSEMSVDELSKCCKKLATRLGEWLELQRDVLVSTMLEFIDNATTLSASTVSIDEPEKWAIRLPSFFSANNRVEHNMTKLAEDEIKLRKGSLFDAIRQVRDLAKALSVLRKDKSVNARSTSARTRAMVKLNGVEQRLEIQVRFYNKCRDALIALDGEDSGKVFPPMTKEDTYRAPTHVRRELRSSRLPVNRPWNTGVSAGTHVTTHAYIEDEEAIPRTNLAMVQTTGTQTKTRKDKKAYKDKAGAKQGLGTRTQLAEENDGGKTESTVPNDGWIWRLGAMGDLSSTQIRIWSEESDSVQWFRAEAEMQRWQEEVEIKQAEFLRCIRSFSSMSEKWTQLGKLNSHSPGRMAYTKKRAAQYTLLGHDAKTLFCSAGYKDRMCQSLEKHILLADMIKEDRRKEALAFKEDVAGLTGRRQFELVDY